MLLIFVIVLLLNFLDLFHLFHHLHQLFHLLQHRSMLHTVGVLEEEQEEEQEQVPKEELKKVVKKEDESQVDWALAQGLSKGDTKSKKVSSCHVRESEIKVEKPERKRVSWQIQENPWEANQEKGGRHDDMTRELLGLLGPPPPIHIPERLNVEEQVLH